MIEDTLDALSRYLPNIRQIADYTEAATPRTFLRYTGHMQGATFGTKFPGLATADGLHKESRRAFSTPAPSASSCPAGWAQPIMAS